MKFRIENVAYYKKVVTAICSIPSVRKQLNGVEQCIEIKTNKEKGKITIATVDLTSHAIRLDIDADVIEEGRQIVLSNKIKGLTSKLNPKYGLVVSSDNNRFNYEAKPFGSIAEEQYFSQDSCLSEALFDEPKWSDVTPDVGFFLDLIPMAFNNTYSDREIYVTTSNGSISMYVQFSETSYIKYNTTSETNALVSGFRAAIRPALLKMVLLLGDEVSLYYCPEKRLIKFESLIGAVVISCDMSVNKVCKIIDMIIAKETISKLNIDHEELIAGLNFQSYGKTDADIVSLSYDIESNQFNLSTNSITKPTTLSAILEGEFDKTTVSVGHLLKGLKAMGSAKNKVLPIEVIDIQIKSIPVANANPIKVVHLVPEASLDVSSDIIIYEASC